MSGVSDNQADLKMLIPVARRKFTTVECYINVGSFGKDGHDEAVRHIREKCPKHLDIDMKAICLQMTMF